MVVINLFCDNCLYWAVDVDSVKMFFWYMYMHMGHCNLKNTFKAGLGQVRVIIEICHIHVILSLTCYAIEKTAVLSRLDTLKILNHPILLSLLKKKK